MSHPTKLSFSSVSDLYTEQKQESKSNYFQRYETTGNDNPTLFTADIIGVLGDHTRFHSYALIIPGSHRYSRFFDLLFKHQVVLFTGATSSFFRSDFIFDSISELNDIVSLIHQIESIPEQKDSMQMATVRAIKKELGKEYVDNMPERFDAAEIKLPKPSLIIFHPQLYVRYVYPDSTSGFAGVRTVVRKYNRPIHTDINTMRLQQWEGLRLPMGKRNAEWPMNITVDPTRKEHPLMKMESIYHKSLDINGFIVTTLAHDLVQVKLLGVIDQYLKHIIGLGQAPFTFISPTCYTKLPIEYHSRINRDKKSTHFPVSGFTGYGHFSHDIYTYVEKIKPLLYTLLKVMLQGEGTIHNAEIIFRIRK